MANRLLEVTDLEVAYGDVRALWGVSIHVDAGSVVAIVGANGAGKTTLLKAVSGLIPAKRGEIKLSGTSLLGRLPEDIARLGIAHVPEGRGLFRQMTVLENLELGAFQPKARVNMKRALEKAYDLFPRLKERTGQKAGSLSGGEQQMLSIGRALMARPKLLLLDEPSLGLAPLIVKQIFDAIRELNRTQGLTVFLVEQNAFGALKLATRGYVMVNGNVTMSGTGKDLLANPEVRAAYLEGGHH